MIWFPTSREKAKDTRAIQHLPRKAAYNYPKEMYVASHKVGEAEPSKTFEIKISDIGYGAIWFGACPDGFKSWFGTVFFHFSSALK